MSSERVRNPEGALKGKVAIVTGGASGIGKATAIEFIKEGAKVAVFDISFSPPKEFKGLGIFYHVVDITNEETVRTAVKQVEKDFGPITTLVNNAGITQASSTIDKQPIDDWQKVIGINLTGQFMVTQYVVARMKELQTQGSVIFITSIHDGIGFSGFPAYNAAKSGLLNFMRTLSLEAGPFGIRSNAIAPGAIDPTGISRMTQKQREGYAKSIPLRRIGAPEDVARAAVFLASDNASYITGARIPVDGGSSQAPSLREVD